MKKWKAGGGVVKTNTQEFGFHLRRWQQLSHTRVYATRCLAELILQLHPQKHLRLVPSRASLLLPYFSTCLLQLQPPSEALAVQGDSLIR